MHTTRMFALVLLLCLYSQALNIATDVRLSHGSNRDGVEFKSYEGAIEVLVDGQWGPIIRHGVDSVTAKTMCKLLGHGLTGFVVERFSFTGIPVLASLSCLGNETSITQCTQVEWTAGGERYDAPGVHCFEQVFDEVRLTDGEGPNNGTVNIKMDGRWGLLCGYPTGNRFPTPTVDLAICRTLGYQETLDQAPRFGQYSDVYIGWLDVDKIHCDGDESNLNQCTVSQGTLHRQPRCSNIRGVNCVTRLDQFCSSDEICAAVKNAVCMDNICRCKIGHSQTDQFVCTALNIATDVRLSHGPNSDGVEFKSYEGAIEVLVDGQWGPIIRHGVDSVTAKTMCKLLGHGLTGFVVERFEYIGIPVLYNLSCLGNETSITQCTQVEWTAKGEKYDAPGVHCFEQVFDEVRLTDGEGPNNGTVNIKVDGRWGLLCGYPTGNTFSTPAVDLAICRTLGYQETLDQAPRFGQYSDVYIGWLDVDKIHCDGDESNLNQCTVSQGTLHRQPRCSNIRGVNCVTRLDQFCTSDEICAAVENAVCVDNICRCKLGHSQTDQYACNDCEQGFYHQGSNCEPCACHGNGIGPCDKQTGVCQCTPGWDGDRCTINVDECFTSNVTCPEGSMCIDHPGYFTCECDLGYMFNGSLCEVCSETHFGQNCSEVCDCEMNNVEPTLTNRVCDIVSGDCMCKSGWMGSRCGNVSTSGTTDTSDTQRLIIIVSSAAAGCLLLVVIVTVCVCKCRKPTKNASSSKPRNIELNVRNGSHKGPTTTMTSFEVTEYNTINDSTLAADVKVDTDYDLHPDLLEGSDQFDESINKEFKDNGYDSAGYLRPRKTNTSVDYDYADGNLRTDDDGFLDLEDQKQKSTRAGSHFKTDKDGYLDLEHGKQQSSLADDHFKTDKDGYLQMNSGKRQLPKVPISP